jgi:hypothetical protein
VSTTKTFAGQSFNLPLNREPKSSGWGTEVSNFLIALADNAIPKTGGSYTLSAELNLGATYGLLAPYLKSAGTNIASAGVVRLAKDETIGFRNNANSADLALAINGSDKLTFNGVVLATAGAASIVNADISTSAAIAYSKLALTGAILNADLAGSIAYSKLSLTGAILSADLAGSIAYGKLSLSGSIATTDLASGLLVPIGKGGTGQTTANTALNALLPDQTSNSGKVLSSDGTSTLWASALTSTLTQYNVSVGNGSSVATSTDTNLLGDVKAQTKSQTSTVTVATPAVFTSNGHGMAAGDKFYLTTTGALPTGLAASTTYYASNVATNTFQASASYAQAIAGIYIATSGSQSGTHTLVTGGLTIPHAYLESRVLGATAIPASGVVGDFASITLSAGDWDVSALAEITCGSTTISEYWAEIALGTASGTGTTGITAGYNAHEIRQAAATNNRFTHAIAPVRITSDGTNLYMAGSTYSSTQTVYLKYSAPTYTGTVPSWVGVLRARLIVK